MVTLQLVQALKDLDISLLRVIFENRDPSFDTILRAVTNTAAVIAFGFPAVLLLNGLFKKNKDAQINALLLIIPVAVSAIVSNILKYVIDLPRPYEIYPFIHKLSVGGSPSFPSGHTADAFAFAAAVSLRYRKWFIVAGMLLWASLVGYTRMALGVHFPSDVLAGAIIGILCAYFAYRYTKTKYPTDVSAKERMSG